MICDLGETYQIYDYKSYPVSLIATLAVGLGPESRIKRYLSQTLYPLDATPENLRKLSGDIIDLHVCPTGDLVLFITGPWI